MHNCSNTTKETHVRQSPWILSSLRPCLHKDLHILLLQMFAGTKRAPRLMLAHFQQLR